VIEERPGLARGATSAGGTGGHVLASPSLNPASEPPAIGRTAEPVRQMAMPSSATVPRIAPS
jgi:hypothetical protein